MNELLLGALIEDDRDPVYTDWLGSFAPEFTLEWTQMLGSSLTEDALSPSYHEIRIEDRSHSSWVANTLSIGEALDLMSRLYRILVENGFSDRNFLLSLCSKNDREWLEKRVGQEWVEIEHCGGKQHLYKRVLQSKTLPSRCTRTSALFDGDGVRPNAPENQRISDVCYPDVHHHMLRRRSIENYLPRKVLERWAKLSDGLQKEIRTAKVRALFEELGRDQRSHYNFKHGLAGDSRRHDRADDLYLEDRSV
ncbi:hypothetical protein [Sorangium sp. So ce124]|uniref:hypothetical protein n=1 Tax=Sorangium sp. So ce124 TaxID=3133280 RepID=UPI003F5FD011